jgi:hypothetical protein
MKKALLAFILITMVLPIYSIELSEPDPEDTKRITAIIQYTSVFRFGNNLKKGDEVVYEVNEVVKTDEYSEHILKVIDKDNNSTTVLEIFEGNELYIQFESNTKKVIKIWGKDIAGGDHFLTLLSDNELDNIITEKNNNTPEEIKLNKWKTSEPSDEYDVNNQVIHCKIIELDIDNLDLPATLKEKMRKENNENSITLSDDIPKMLPLVPVAFTNTSKREMLTYDNAGFVQNINLTLKSFIKN